MRRPLAVAAITVATVVGAVALPGAAAASPTVHPHSKTVAMSGKQEVPGPGDRNGKGWFSWKVGKWQLCYVITASRIRPATMAHIHRGAKGVAGPVVVGLKAPTDGRSSGCIKAVKRQNAGNAASKLTWAELRGIARHPERYYVNVHNTRYPDGAIRGQLR